VAEISEHNRVVILRLAADARPQNEADYASERQVEAQTRFFEVVEPLIPADKLITFVHYINKATTDEMIDEALRVIGVRP
jgi:hypothetical protein